MVVQPSPSTDKIPTISDSMALALALALTTKATGQPNKNSIVYHPGDPRGDNEQPRRQQIAQETANSPGESEQLGGYNTSLLNISWVVHNQICTVTYRSVLPSALILMASHAYLLNFL